MKSYIFYRAFGLTLKSITRDCQNHFAHVFSITSFYLLLITYITPRWSFGSEAHPTMCMVPLV